MIREHGQNDPVVTRNGTANRIKDGLEETRRIYLGRGKQQQEVTLAFNTCFPVSRARGIGVLGCPVVARTGDPELN